MFLDIQRGHAALGPEMAYMTKYLKLPFVHLGIDPEFSMVTGAKPGTKIGSYDAADVNQAVQFLSRIVKENNLPPKVLVVHRFTQGMIKNYKNIKLDPNVQIVMDMTAGDHRYSRKTPTTTTSRKNQCSTQVSNCSTTMISARRVPAS